jgi:hypothetical protein
MFLKKLRSNSNGSDPGSPRDPLPSPKPENPAKHDSETTVATGPDTSKPKYGLKVVKDPKTGKYVTVKAGRRHRRQTKRKLRRTGHKRR